MLTPTLWRSCRVLAHAGRLRALTLVFKEPAGITVGEVAERLDIPVPTASVYLRALNARGLLAAHRRGRYVRYAARADHAVRGADELLAALRIAMENEAREPAWLIRRVTAFTHPRRVVMVRLLEYDWQAAGLVRRRARISREAFIRHLRKLEDRGVLARNRRRGLRLLPPSDTFSAVLLTLARET